MWFDLTRVEARQRVSKRVKSNHIALHRIALNQIKNLEKILSEVLLLWRKVIFRSNLGKSTGVLIFKFHIYTTCFGLMISD